jgi:hypothetical protein
MSSAENPEEKAVRLITRQLEELQTIRGLNIEHPEFKAWRDTTRGILERFLGSESHHTTRFRGLRFSGPPIIRTDLWGGGGRLPENYISPEDAQAFQKGCETTEASLKAAIKHIEDFGVYIEPARVVPAGRGRSRSGGVNFHAPVNVQNLAVAADNAVQRIGRVGDTTGTSLKEIADLLQQSEDLTPRQVKEGLAGIEALAVEARKPEAQRNWKSILDYGQAVLGIAEKATDLGHKLSLYTPAIATLVENAKHFLK